MISLILLQIKRILILIKPSIRVSIILTGYFISELRRGPWIFNLFGEGVRGLKSLGTTVIEGRRERGGICVNVGLPIPTSTHASEVWVTEKQCGKIQGDEVQFIRNNLNYTLEDRK